MIKCTFSDVLERDMDLLFLEEFAGSQEFLDLFLEPIGLSGAGLLAVEQSKTDIVLGESDITLIVQKGGKNYGILIEDKIDAIAQENQSGRYIERGEKGQENGDFQEFFVFIVAPQKYLDANAEAKKYHHSVTYEKCLEYFKSKNDNRSIFKAQQIEQAIEKQKRGYQAIEDKAVTAFWDNYISYQEINYPRLLLISKRGPKGSNAKWPIFRTSLNNCSIYHKSDKGFVDLEFSGRGDKTEYIKKILSDRYGNLWDNDLLVEKTGKSAVLRIRVPKMDFREKFENYSNEINEVFDAVDKLYSILDEIAIDIFSV